MGVQATCPFNLNKGRCVMKKLKFKGAVTFPAYRGKGVVFHDGDTKEVSDDVADYLLNDFPENFTEIKPKKKKSKKREVKSPPKDKMMKKSKTKSK